MDPVEKLAQAIWESAELGDEFPWETLRDKPKAGMLRVARDVIYTVTRTMDLLKLQNLEDPTP